MVRGDTSIVSENSGLRGLSVEGYFKFSLPPPLTTFFFCPSLPGLNCRFFNNFLSK